VETLKAKMHLIENGFIKLPSGSRSWHRQKPVSLVPAKSQSVPNLKLGTGANGSSSLAYTMTPLIPCSNEKSVPNTEIITEGCFNTEHYQYGGI
jgi:hypothetical protein